MKKRRNKILAFFLACVLFVSLFGSFAIGSFAATVSGIFGYTLSNGEATIMALHPQAKGSVTVPATIDGYPVVALENEAFAGHAGVTDIVLSEGIKTLGGSAFANCQNLKSVWIPKSVTKIEANLLYGCPSLTGITVAEGNPKYQSSDNCLVDIEEKVLLHGCKSSIIPADGSVRKIGAYAFYGVEDVTRIPIPDGIEAIEGGAFYACPDLTEIFIPASVTYIGSHAFYGCPRLDTITASSANTVYRSQGNALIETASGTVILGCQSTVFSQDGSIFAIGSDAFAGCTGLKTVEIPDSVTKIGAYAFSGCTSLSEVSFGLGSKLTELGYYAFYGCASLSKIQIPKGVTALSFGTFRDCESLERVSLHSTLESIGAYAFYGCSALKSICYFGNVAEWQSLKKAESWKLGAENSTVYIKGALGDINGDGFVNFTDVAVLTAYCANTLENLSLVVGETDLNGDSFTNFTDVAVLTAYCANAEAE